MITLVVLLAALGTHAAPAGVQPAAATATCRSVGLDPARTWRLERKGVGWRIAHWRGGQDGAGAVSVALPASSEVRLSTQAIAVRGKTSNGGIDVTLTGTPAAATLDVYVSYELEVNVDAALTPAIDELNTDGPIGVRCEITQD